MRLLDVARVFWWQEDEVKVDFKIAIGSPNGRRSDVWRVVSHKDEVYVMHSMMGKEEKISFHKSLKCRRAFHEHTKPEGMEDRVIEKWQRAPTPKIGISYAMVVIIPTDTLSIARITQKDVHWILPAPLGGTTVLEFLFTRDDEQETRKHATAHNRELLSYSVLPNDDAFAITKTTGEWKGEDFVAEGIIEDNKKYVISRDDPNNTGRPARFSTFRRINGGTVLEVWEYGAYKVPLDTAFSKPMGRFTRTKLLKRHKTP